MEKKNYTPYLKDDLGATYHKDHTDFVIWAPVSSEAILNIETKKGDFKAIPMAKGEDNSYRITVKGNLLNKKYYYTVTNDGKKVNTNDPWGKGASFNSEYSAVVDIDYIKKIKNIKPSTKIKQNTDAIIYEASIRDFTEDKNTNIVNKGKFLSLTEEKRTTAGGNPAGLDYHHFHRNPLQVKFVSV